MATHFVAVDVGGTKILTAVVTDAGAIVARQKQKTERGSKKRLVEQIQDAISGIIKAANLNKADVAGIALGVPGVIDAASGHVVVTPNAPLSDTPLGAIVRERFDCPVAIANDVNLGVFGEHWCGAAQGTRSSFGIFVGTGIGGGLVIDGKLIQGHRGLAGEIGHLMIPLGADEISGMLTRKQLFLEDLCSRTAIENQLRHAILSEGQPSALTEIVGDKKLQRIRSGALRDALRRKDPLVTGVMRRASYLLGLATASVLHVVDPEVIIFGGGVIEACGQWMLPLIERTAHKVAMPGTGKGPRVVRSALGDDAIILGGVALLRQGDVVSRPAPPRDSPPATVPAVAELAPEPPPQPRSEPDARPAPRPPLAQVDKPLESS